MVEIPASMFLAFFAGLLIFFILGCLGIYYLVSKNYSNVSIIISLTIYLSALLCVMIKHPKILESLYLFGLPFSFLSAFFDEYAVSEIIFCLIGLSINYLVVFGLVNFVRQIISKTMS